MIRTWHGSQAPAGLQTLPRRVTVPGDAAPRTAEAPTGARPGGQGGGQRGTRAAHTHQAPVPGPPPDRHGSRHQSFTGSKETLRLETLGHSCTQRPVHGATRPPPGRHTVHCQPSPHVALGTPCIAHCTWRHFTVIVTFTL